MEVTKVSSEDEYIKQVRAFGAVTQRDTLPAYSMFDLHDAGTFNFRPAYQRKFIWTKKMASRLIESIILGVAFPEIYVRRTPANGRFYHEVVDGQQRCMAVYCFYRNENPWHKGEDFRLVGCDRLPMLNGMKFSDLPQPMQAAFLNYQLGVIAVMGMGNKAVTEFFELLNQNTVRLTAQEIRNACYQGPFNNLCMELAALPEFRKLIGGGSDLRMESTELVVRVLAFYRLGAEGYSRTAKNSLKGFMNSEMEFWQAGNFTEVRERRLRRAFQNAATLSGAVFGKDVFRKKPGAKARISNVLLELVMCGFADRTPETVLCKADEIKEALFSLCAQPDFDSSISRATADRNNVTSRFAIWNRTLDNILVPSTILFLGDLDDEAFPEVAVAPQPGAWNREDEPQARMEEAPAPVAKKWWSIFLPAPPARVVQASAVVTELALVKNRELLTPLA